MPNLLTFSPEDVDVAQLNNAIASKTYLTVGQTPGCDVYCDGTADDEQISEALDASDVVMVKSGTYMFRDLIQLANVSNKILFAEQPGTVTFKAQDSYNPASTPVIGSVADGRIMVYGSNIENCGIYGVKFDNNVQNIAGLTNNTHHRTVFIDDVSHFVMSHCLFDNPINWTVVFTNFNRVWFKRNTILGGYGTYLNNDGVVFRNGTHAWILNNYIDTNHGGGTSGDDAIAVLGDANGSAETAHITIAHNHLSSYLTGIKLGCEENDLRDVQVTDNKLWYSRAGGIVLQKFDATSAKMIDINIEDNKISNYGATGATGGVAVVGTNIDETIFEDLTIDGNKIRDCKHATSNGIYVIAKGTGLKVDNNKISKFIGDSAIRLGKTTGPVKDFSVDNNQIDFSLGASNGAGIRIFGGDRGSVSHNKISGHKGGTSYGIRLEGGNTAGNDALGVANAEVSGHTVVEGNNIYNVDNPISEVNGGSEPDWNLITDNILHACTSDVVTIGDNTSVVSGTNLVAS